MIKELADQLQMLKFTHVTIDKLLEGLTDEQWTKKPGEGFNSIASIIDHTAKVERKFMAAVAGEKADVDTHSTFKQETWDVSAIQADWRDVLTYSESVLSRLQDSDLDEVAFIHNVFGELNKRQLISLSVAHAAHHRGQLPLLKKLLGV